MVILHIYHCADSTSIDHGKANSVLLCEQVIDTRTAKLKKQLNKKQLNKKNQQDFSA